MAVALGRMRLGLLLASTVSTGLCMCSTYECIEEQWRLISADSVVLLQTSFGDIAKKQSKKTKAAVSRAIYPGSTADFKDIQKRATDTTQATLKVSVSTAFEVAWCISPLLIIALGLQLLVGSQVAQMAEKQKEHTANHIDALTGVRAPLMLMIFFYHASVLPFNVSGAFIMLSGTVLSASRMTAHGEIKAPFHSAGDVGKFILRRWLRVLPLSMVCFCMPGSANGLRQFWSEWAVNMVYYIPHYLKDMTNLLSAASLSQFWFVQVIMVLYAFYPLLEELLVYLRRNIARWWLWSLGCCFLLKVCTIVFAYSAFQRGALVQDDWYVVPQYHVSLYTFPLLWIPDFLAGMILPYLEATRIQITQSQVLVTCVDIMALCVVFLMFVMPMNSALVVLANLHAFAPCTALFMWSLFPGNGSSLCRRLLSGDLIVHLSTFSFAFYLCQLQFLGLWNAYTARIWFSPRAYGRCSDSYSLACGLRFNLLQDSSTVFSFFAALLFTSWTSWALYIVVERPISRVVMRCLG